jgi:Tol biopolymer transport system component
MHDHTRILELAASAIDFDLDPAERAELNAALENCPLCRRQASAMRATATILGRASDIGTPSRVRDVVIGAALRNGSRSPGWRPLLAASLSLLVVFGGAAVLVGSRGPASGPSAPPTSPVQSAVALASPTPSPIGSPTPTPTPVPSPAPTQSDLPDASLAPENNGALQAGDIAAMVTTGHVVIRTKPGTAADSAVYKIRINPGQRVLVLDGPVEASGYPWFHVRLGSIEGWAAGAGLDGETWLAPISNGRIAFVRSGADGTAEGIYTIPPDGSQPAVPLFTDASITSYRQLRWSPDGQRLAFAGRLVDGGNGSSEVFAIDADGSNLIRVTENDVDDDSPVWSPDGTRLAVRVVDPSVLGGSNVVVTPVDVPGVTILGAGANPVWSPDGLLLAMTVFDGSSTTLWVQAANGNDRRQVSAVAVASAPPAWSPDGQELAFISSGLFQVDAASGSVSRVAADPAWGPSWSAGGAIAFTTPGSASPGVFTVNPDGSALERVWDDSVPFAVPSWSPDGRRLLVYGSLADGSMQVLDRNPGGLTTLATDGPVSWPAWQPQVLLFGP